MVNRRSWLFRKEKSPPYRRGRYDPIKLRLFDGQYLHDHMGFKYPRQGTTNCIKYMLSIANLFFWFTGLAVIMIGIYSWLEKDTFKNIGKLVSQRALFFDPAFLFLIGGLFIFIVAFFGCFGAFRENRSFLLMYTLILLLLFVAQMSVVIYTIIHREETGDILKVRLYELIKRYRDDKDLKNLVDWIQRDWLKCCGVINYKDWNYNNHFNCSAFLDRAGKTMRAPAIAHSFGANGVDACGVPNSCCKNTEAQKLLATINRTLFRNGPFNSSEMIAPLMSSTSKAIHNSTVSPHCGRKVLLPNANLSQINIEGCLQSAYVWIVKHSTRLAFVAACLLFIQILGISLALGLRANIAEKQIWIDYGMFGNEPPPSKSRRR